MSEIVGKRTITIDDSMPRDGALTFGDLEGRLVELTTSFGGQGGRGPDNAA
jgi:hypothetical protein